MKIIKNILICDFASLYPNIIIYHNMDLINCVINSQDDKKNRWFLNDKYIDENINVLYDRSK